MCGSCQQSEKCNTCTNSAQVFTSYRDRLVIPTFSISEDALKDDIFGEAEKQEAKPASKLWWLSLLAPFAF